MKDKRKLLIETLAVVQAISGDYADIALDLYNPDLELEFDEATQACKSKMYMYMLGGRKEDEEAFWTLYNALDERKKAYIDREYQSIITAEEEKENQKTIKREDDIYE